ncbi:AMP-binding protein [Pseudoalteromonas fenneropenaei]|uniref:AMP-binding protein n=1 Tax=Pseudoalteromonas fenneropenaei TaxID=1737459 RepID=A0ABV7CH08_9GAMM
MNQSLICERFPERVAVISENGLEVTYRQLRGEIESVAKYLAPRSVIFIQGENHFQSLLYYLAALESGVVPLMLSHELSELRLQELVDTYQPRYIVRLAERELAGFVEKVRHDGYVLLESERVQSQTIHPELAFLATTSGTTGSPKLVRYTRKNLLANAADIATYLSLDENERAILHLPIHYSFGLSIINSHLYVGASIVLTRKTVMQKEFWDEMRRHRVTSFSGVPFHYETLVRLKLAELALPDLKTFTLAGGRLSESKMALFAKQCLDLGLQFWPMYGQTEASPRISYLEPDFVMAKLGSIGKAVPSGKLWIRSESGQDITATGAIGELVYEGENVCLGYAQTLADLSLGDEKCGVLFTGDLAKADEEGFFYLQGRIKRFIKVFGKRVSLDHVEQMLVGMGLQVLVGGTDDKLVVGIVDEGQLDTTTLRKQIAELVHVNFTAITIKPFSAFPRLENGKVNYQCLLTK